MVRLLQYFLAVIFTAFSGIALSQNENKKWYFGQNCALDFATNPPTNLANGAMATAEACASVSDASGNLLFYTNGVTIWNQSHSVMANGTGLLGDANSAQGALIVKQPGNSTTYFVFTTDGGTNGLCYSVVDIGLAAGMGSVTVKNTLIHAPSTERLCGAIHCNGADTWIISHDKNSNIFRANLLSATGVNTTPVLSAIGSPVYSTGACMKISPNGKKLAASIYNPPYAFEIYDFNAATGTISNVLNLPVALPAYGCEFSPDGTKFYGSYSGALCQWDLCEGSAQAIAASASTLNVTPIVRPGQLQLGPDGKIYLARALEKKVKLTPEMTIYVTYGEPMLGVIHSPNANAGSINFNMTGQSVSPALSMYGLPNFVSGFYKTPVAEFTYTVNPAVSCVKAFFNAPPLINATCSATSYTINTIKWLFDDPASGSANTSALISPEHQYPGNGTYNVRLILYNDCGGVIDTVRKQVIVGGALTNNPSDFSICLGESLTLEASASSSYTWSTGATTSSIIVTPTTNTTYSVSNIDAFGCLNRSVQTITVNPPPAITVAGNTLICEGSLTTLTVSGGVTYSWSTGSSNSAISVTPAATTIYTLTSASFNGCIINTDVTVVVKPAPLIPLAGSTLACAGAVSTLVASGAATYLWSNGTQGPTFTVVPTRNNRAFSATLTYSNGCVRYKQFIFEIQPLPTVSVAGITTVCAGAIVTQTASGAISYSWSNGLSTNPAGLTPLDNTTFTVTGTDANNCKNTATVLITVKPSATVSANSVIVCSGQTTTLKVTSTVVPGVNYMWDPWAISGDSIVVPVTSSQIYTVTANLKGCINSATGSIHALPAPNLVLDKEIKILPGSSATLHVSGSTTYSWNPPDSLSCYDCEAPVVTPAASTRYCVRASIGDCITEACINVAVSCESNNDYSVPNAFTPNGDGNNDQFCLQGWDECMENFNVMIFDRWGEKVYESGNPSFCWDGTYRGQLLNSGVFIYVIKAKKFNGKTDLSRRGNISLIR